MMLPIYHKQFPIDTPKEVRNKHNVGDIFWNKAKCLKCGETISSGHVHDFVRCSCGNLAVDGGSFYAKRMFMEAGTWQEMSENYDDCELNY